MGKLMRSAIGLVVALIGFQLFGSGGGGGGGGDWTELDHLPETVFGGGGGNVGLTVQVNQPAVLKASFEQWDEETGEDTDYLSAAVEIDPGTRSFNVQVPDDTYLYFELGVPEASVGATAEWTLTLNGNRIWSEKDELAEPLQDGYAFFLQIEAEDLEDLQAWAEYYRSKF